MNKTIVENISVNNFRNLTDIRTSFCEGVNLFYGKNGQGKTNLLECLALVLSLKTVYTRTNEELVQFEQEQACIRGACRSETRHFLDIKIGRKGKRAFLNEKPIRSAQSLLDTLSVISFVPDDLQMVHRSSTHRRKYIDQVSTHLFPSYYADLRNYDRALRQRNALLKDRFFDISLLGSYTDVLVEHGAQVIKSRAQAMDKLSPYFDSSLQELSSDFVVSATYAPSVKIPEFTIEEIKLSFLTELESRQSEERARGCTVAGPHLDDLQFKVGPHLAKELLSRGQTRLTILALKMAHLEALRDLKQITPVLLLDDVLSELDENHTKLLFKALLTHQPQTFITSTDADLPHFEPSCEVQKYLIEAGQIIS